jgi:hypothetical protein
MNTTSRFRDESTLDAAAYGSSRWRTALALFLLLAGALFCEQVVTTAAAAESGESATKASEIPSTFVKHPLPSRVLPPDQKTAPEAENKPVDAERDKSVTGRKRVETSESVVIKALPARTVASDQKAPAAAGTNERIPSAAGSAATVAVENTADVHSSGEKRPLPLRTGATDVKRPLVISTDEKTAPVAVPIRPSSADRNAEVLSTGEKRPLPLRTVTPDQKTPVTARADEKKPSASESAATVTAEKKAEGPSSGEKRPLPLRTRARDQDMPAAVAADAKKPAGADSDQPSPAVHKAEEPGGGEKRPLPARSLSADLKTAVPGAAEAKKSLEAEQQSAAPFEKIVAGSSNGEKRPLPLRSLAQGQNVSVAAKAEAKTTVDAEADRVSSGGSQVLSPPTGLHRPLPARTLARDQKASVVATVEAKKPYGAEKLQSGSVEMKSEAPALPEKRPLPRRIAMNEQKTEINKTKPSVAEKTASVTKMPLVKEQAATANSEQKQLSEEAGTSSVRWTVVVGSYLLESALATDLAKIKKAGLTGLVQPGDKKLSTMNRLLLAEYDDRGVAQAALGKLKRHTADAFMLDHGGKYAVYAGSYLLDTRAAFEKERLSAAGFALALKRAEVAIPSKSLSAGSFTDKNTAEAALNKLKAAGIKATLVRQ